MRSYSLVLVEGQEGVDATLRVVDTVLGFTIPVMVVEDDDRVLPG